MCMTLDTTLPLAEPFTRVTNKTPYSQISASIQALSKDPHSQQESAYVITA